MRLVIGFFIFILSCSVLMGQDKTAVPDTVTFITVKNGITEGVPLEGDWSLAEGRLVQSAGTEKRALYRLPFVQERKDYRFRFAVQSKAPGWVGGGLHILASGGGRSGYGYGSSFLVWLTRDAGYYKNESTYLQLYRSFSNAFMIQVVSVSIPERLEDGIPVEVLYNAELEILSLSVNGDLRLFFPIKNMEATGTDIAFRTLGGPITFSNLEILASDR